MHWQPYHRHFAVPRTQESFYRALKVANLRSSSPIMKLWYTELNDCCVATGDLATYVHFFTLRHSRNTKDDYESVLPLTLHNLHGTVAYKGQDRNPDEVVREVMGELKKNRVGLAKEHCEPLAKAIGGDAAATQLLEDLQVRLSFQVKLFDYLSRQIFKSSQAHQVT